MSLRAAALALVLLLSGCLGAQDAPPGSDAEGPLVLPFGLRGCDAAVVAVPVPQSALAEHMPEGFRSLSLQELGLAGSPNPRGDGNFGVEMLTCDEADGIGGIAAPAVYGSFFTLVEPPEEHRRDVTLHIVKWDVVVADPATREALRAEGVPAWDAEASFSQFNVVGPGVAFAGQITFNGTFGVSFRGGGGAPYDPTGSFVEYTEVPAGLATWSTNYTWRAIGVGPATVQATGDSLATKILGTRPHEGAAFAGFVDFHDGNVTVPR